MRNPRKIGWAARLLLALNLLALVPALQHVHNETYRQWSAPSGWVSIGMGLVHAPGLLLLAVVLPWLLSACSIVLVGIWWFRARKDPPLPHKRFAAWLAANVTTVVAYLPSSTVYAALAVLVLGPGPNAVRLQHNAVNRDSVLLLNVFALRGAALDPPLLVYAAGGESPAVVANLLARGLPVNGQHYPSQITALHSAVERRQYPIAEMLMAAGARPDIANARGMTPLDLARARNDERMIAILTRKL